MERLQRKGKWKSFESQQEMAALDDW